MRVCAPNKTAKRAASLVAAAVALAGCSLARGGDDTASEPSSPSASATGTVVLLTHDSFTLPKKLIGNFEKETGLDLEVRSGGDAGELTTRLVLSEGSPEGDVAFGVDNTFASRALEAGVFEPLQIDLPEGVDQYALPGAGDILAAVDTGAVCVNVDKAWFKQAGVAMPATLADLIKPEYKGLFVLPGASTSSPGMAFLLSTIAEYGDQWPDYWRDLMANDAKVTSGWTDAYTVDFTAGGGNGDRPIVLSYDSSPAFTVSNGRSTTKALLDTCFRQVEYAGVLTGAENPAGARVVIEWLLSPAVQNQLPESMYVFPTAGGVVLPAEWAKFAKQPEATKTVDPAEIAANRQDWLTTWTDIISR